MLRFVSPLAPASFHHDLKDSTSRSAKLHKSGGIREIQAILHRCTRTWTPRRVRRLRRTVVRERVNHITVMGAYPWRHPVIRRKMIILVWNSAQIQIIKRGHHSFTVPLLHILIQTFFSQKRLPRMKMRTILLLSVWRYWPSSRHSNLYLWVFTFTSF